MSFRRNSIQTGTNRLSNMHALYYTHSLRRIFQTLVCFVRCNGLQFIFTASRMKRWKLKLHLTPRNPPHFPVNFSESNDVHKRTHFSSSGNKIFMMSRDHKSQNCFTNTRAVQKPVILHQLFLSLWGAVTCFCFTEPISCQRN